MLFLIGLDDTDNATSEDTINLAERLGFKLEENHIAKLVAITSHQLSRNSSIAFTSTNQCACLLVDAHQEDQRDLELVCRGFLLRECAPGSNAGFALSPWSGVAPAVITWGQQAKATLLTRQEAMTLAHENNIAIAGFTGSGSGVIGALAAVGLYFDGNDGCFQWLPGLRDLHGVYTLLGLLETCNIGRVENARSRRPLPGDRINIVEGAIPILRGGKSLLLVEPAKKDDLYEWNTVSNEKALRIFN